MLRFLSPFLSAVCRLFDYRPYVTYWCPGLSSLDGTPITAKEKYDNRSVSIPHVMNCASLRLRSVSLFHSDHAYPFQLGQHQPLVQYLTTACPLPILQNQVLHISKHFSLIIVARCDRKMTEGRIKRSTSGILTRIKTLCIARMHKVNHVFLHYTRYAI